MLAVVRMRMSVCRAICMGMFVLMNLGVRVRVIVVTVGMGV